MKFSNVLISTSRRRRNFLSVVCLWVYVSTRSVLSVFWLWFCVFRFFQLRISFVRNAQMDAITLSSHFVCERRAIVINVHLTDWNFFAVLFFYFFTKWENVSTFSFFRPTIKTQACVGFEVQSKCWIKKKKFLSFYVWLTTEAGGVLK